jgi:peptidoglycan hydrolase-like protein with peptidoglycan-binding domain
VGGNRFSTLSGGLCAGMSSGCEAGNLYSPVTGERCAGAVSVTPTPGTPSPSGYAFGLTAIRQGSSGASCLAWQTFFNAKKNAGLVLDGKCGPLTMAAARAWQSASGLVADGILGPMSRAKAMSQ